jgi:eukaryotic-like serine/threonine-protein kinase
VFKFITGRPLWANILLGIGILLVLFFLFFQSLSWITRHDKTLAVPSVTGKSYEEAKKILEAQGFEVEIQDTTYVDTAALLSVVKQFPNAESKVKMNRTVYLIINRDAAPDIDMPNLVGMSLRSAEITLQQQKLKIEDTIFVPYVSGQILEQKYKGETIKPGAKIKMGSAITLVIGKGTGPAELEVPDLVGLTLGEARVIIESNGFTPGIVLPEGSTDPNLFVYKQSVPHLTSSGNVNKLREGQVIDVWVQAEKPSLIKADSAAKQP